MNLKTSYFFDLSKFAHAELFDGFDYPWLVLNYLEKYLRTLSLGTIEGDVSKAAHLINPELIYIGKGSVIEPGAYIQGPCWIGNNCVVRHGAYIRGNLLAGERSVIGHDTEVKNAIFLPGAHAAHFAYVGDTILGNGVNLGAGVKCANFKLDKKAVKVQIAGEFIETGMRKLGAMIGDNSQIGCNSVLNPGTLLGKEVNCYPCLNIGGWVPSKSLIKPTCKVAITPILEKI